MAEQHEEEKLFKGILDKLELVGEDGKALFFIDKDRAAFSKGSSSVMDALLSKISKRQTEAIVICLWAFSTQDVGRKR